MFASLIRMTFAYIFSLIFALIYGYYAASTLRRERILLPVLDILQSVPILGFFPVAVVFLINIFGKREIGIELASVFLIFTSQAWNMAFGVYEGMTTIPREAKEAIFSFGGSNWFLVKKLLLPACVPKLVYNSMLSWAGGWYFLVACEIISLGPLNYRLPGIGSIIYQASEDGNYSLLFLALGLLIIIITLMEIYIWRPLAQWAEIYKYEVTGTITHRSPIPKILRSLVVSKAYLLWMERLSRASDRVFSFILRIRKRLIITLRYLFYFVLLFLGSLILYQFIRPLSRDISSISPKIILSLPFGLILSAFRLFVAYSIALAWTIPVAILIAEREGLAKILIPVSSILASIPATAFFPIIVLLVLSTVSSMNLASILLVLTGMQWYILFNVISGFKGVPQDLKEAVRGFGVKGFAYWRKLLIPAALPSIITGSITGWGGGWNALIVSEYVVFKGQVFKTLGIGSLLSEVTYKKGSPSEILIVLTFLVLSITLINKFIWRRLYHLVQRKYIIEG